MPDHEPSLANEEDDIPWDCDRDYPLDIEYGDEEDGA